MYVCMYVFTYIMYSVFSIDCQLGHDSTYIPLPAGYPCKKYFVEIYLINSHCSCCIPCLRRNIKGIMMCLICDRFVIF